MGLLNNAIPFWLTSGDRPYRLGRGVHPQCNHAAVHVVVALLPHVRREDDAGACGRLLLGLAGVAVMVGADAMRPARRNRPLEFSSRPDGDFVVAAISYAFAGVFRRRFPDPARGAAGDGGRTVTASSIIMIPFALLVDRPWTLAPPGWPRSAPWRDLSYSLHARAYIVFFGFLASAGARNAMLVTFLLPVVAILLGVMFLGEILQPRHFAGMALIVLGLAAIDGRPLRRLANLRARST